MTRPLAYVFWHRPKPDVDATAYEAALLAFHARLADTPPPGFVTSRAFAIPDTPWLADGGYEDWYVVEDFAALGQLNSGAVDPEHIAAHEAAARAADFGTAGLYALTAGDVGAAGSWHIWSAERPQTEGAIWQRQMTLGPAPEFCTVGNDVADAGVRVPVRPVTPGPTMPR